MEQSKLAHFKKEHNLSIKEGWEKSQEEVFKEVAPAKPLEGNSSGHDRQVQADTMGSTFKKVEKPRARVGGYGNTDMAEAARWNVWKTRYDAILRDV